MTVRLAPRIFLQGRAAWGQSSNNIRITDGVSVTTGRFDTERWLARGRLTGQWTFGAVHFTPSVSVAYIEDHQKSFVDSGGTLVGAQTASLGQVEFGPEWSYHMQRSHGLTLVPRFALKGIWNFAEDNGAALSGVDVGSGHLRAKTEVGLRLIDKNQNSLEFSGSYDGIGDNDFSAYSGSMKLRLAY
jgi:outer membrane autotransporter protein